ncbi:MAG: PaREP1 family protein, partial [Candidatus Nezhaarchaeales archaeon]
LGIEVQLGWDAANYLHVWGFHEAKLDKEDVEGRIPIIRRLVELLEKQLAVNEKRHSQEGGYAVEQL